MSINTTNGILDITGAVVRVSKMEFKQATGFDTVFNNIARNTILLSDSATYSTASTYHNWALKLPNAWVLEADVYLASGTSGSGDHAFQLNFYNNVNTDVAQGYVLGLDGTSLTLKYDGTQISTATLSSTLNDNAWHKLFVLFERDTFAVAIDGKAEYTFTDSTLRDRVYNDDAGYVVFYHEAGVDRQIKNIKFVNGDKWIRESGSSNIAYIGGSVGIGTHAPKHTLDVLGNANVGTLTVTSVSGDGSGLSLIQSSNVSDFASNVTRIGNLESADMTIDGEKTFSSNLEVGTANLFVDTTTGHVGIANSSPTNTLHVGSNLYVSDTGSTILTVLGNAAVSNKLTVQGFRVSASAFDGLQATTDADNSTTNSIEITNTTASTDTSSGALTVSGGVGIGGDVHAGGSLTLASGLTVDTNTLKVDAGNNRVGILTASPQYGLDVHGTANVGALTATSSTVSGALSGGSASISGALSAASASITGQLLVDTDTLTVDAVNDRVGVNTASPSVDLDVVGEAKVSGNVAVNTNTLFVDSVNSRVGVGTTTPGMALEVYSTTGTQLKLSSSSRYSTIYGVDDTGSCFFGNDGGDFRITTGGNTSGTGASEALRIDSSGYIKQNLMPRFLAYYPNDTNYTDLASGAIIILSTTAFNVGSGYDTSTGYFTAPVDGYYAFHIGIYCSTNASRSIYLKFKENSSSTAVIYNVHQHVAGNASGGQTSSFTAYGYSGYINMANFSFITKMAAGNQIAPAVGGGSLRTYHYRSNISGHMISAA